MARKQLQLIDPNKKGEGRRGERRGGERRRVWSIQTCSTERDKQQPYLRRNT